MISLLVANGADLNMLDEARQTPYQVASTHRNLEAMALLREIGAK